MGRLLIKTSCALFPGSVIFMRKGWIVSRWEELVKKHVLLRAHVPAGGEDLALFDVMSNDRSLVWEVMTAPRTWTSRHVCFDCLWMKHTHSARMLYTMQSFHIYETWEV